MILWLQLMRGDDLRRTLSGVEGEQYRWYRRYSTAGTTFHLCLEGQSPCIPDSPSCTAASCGARSFRHESLACKGPEASLLLVFLHRKRAPDGGPILGKGKQITLDIARGLAFLHEQHIVHLDMKSPNGARLPMQLRRSSMQAAPRKSACVIVQLCCPAGLLN
jgi:hypothetical protein